MLLDKMRDIKGDFNSIITNTRVVDGYIVENGCDCLFIRHWSVKRSK